MERGECARYRFARCDYDILLAVFALLGSTPLLFIVKPLLRKHAPGKIDYKGCERAGSSAYNDLCGISGPRNDTNPPNGVAALLEVIFAIKTRTKLLLPLQADGEFH